MTLAEQFRYLVGYFWVADRPDLRRNLVGAALCLVLAKASNLVTPWLLGETVDTLDRNAVVDVWLLGALGLVFAYALSRLAALVFSEGREVLFTSVSQHAIRALTGQVFSHLHRLPLPFHLSRQTGSLDRLIERGTKAVDFLLRYVAFNVGPTLIELVIVSGIVWALFGGLYAAVIAVSVLAYIALTIQVTTWRLRFRRTMNAADNAVAGRLVDSFVNIETVRLFGNEAYETRRLDEGLATYESAANQSRFSLMLLNLSQTLVVLGGVTTVLVMAALDVQSGALTVGAFVMLNTYMLQAFQPLGFLGSVYREIRQSLIDMENLFEVLSEPAESEAAEMDALPAGAAVVFDQVAFGYRADRSVLRDVSLTIPEGQTVAVVGETGSGKTTLARLLLRFYEPTAGVISIGGMDIRRVSREVLRQRIGVVPQDTVLFNDTLRYNILYGNLGASGASLEAAVEVAGLSAFIASLPEGLDTEVGARGLKLSGGEKQRVAIARAVLKEPAIMVFDEATSSLDTATEAAIQANLERVAMKQTTFVIAHRLSTVTKADQILVLADGRVCEQGSHHELITQDGVYAKLWEAQSQQE
jgi:ATP-binding cassette, subfamily B, heavy metal transporter